MRIQRLKNGVLWIAAANDEEVETVIISAGTWNKVFEAKIKEESDEREPVAMVREM